MQSINAVYDGLRFRPSEHVPVQGSYDVIITFTHPLANSKQALPVKAKGKTIAQLFAGYTGSYPAEFVDYGPAVGNEVEV
jgi:hypothetical protein